MFIGLFDAQPPVGRFLRRLREDRQRDVDAVARAAGISAERVAAIEAWEPDGRRWEIPLASEVDAIARALESSIEAIVTDAHANGFASVTFGEPPDLQRRELVSRVVHIGVDDLAALRARLTSAPANE